MTWRKSTYSGGESGSCVEVGAWRKSTYSGGANNSCVEVGTADSILVRDTTNRDGGTLAFSADAWRAFAGAIK